LLDYVRRLGRITRKVAHVFSLKVLECRPIGLLQALAETAE